MTGINPHESNQLALIPEAIKEPKTILANKINAN